MMDLHDLGDPRGRKSLTIDQLTPDRKEHWNVQLQATTFPTFFENTNPNNRQVTLNVIDGKDWSAENNPNSFLIPLTLVCMSRVDDKTVCYYQQTHDSKGDIINTQISASIELSDDQSKPVENPHLLLTFDQAKQDNQDQLQGDPQRFAGTQNQGQSQPYVNTLKGENANGGLDIPLDQMDRQFTEGDRVVNA